MECRYKFIFYVLLITLLFQQNVFASSIKVNRFSSPIKLTNRILQPINLSIMSSGRWKILVEALDSKIVNQDNPNYSIPVARIQLAESNGAAVSELSAGKIVEINSDLNQGVNSINLTLNTACFDNDRPGNYSTDIKFTLIDENNTQIDDIYNFRFHISEIAKIDFLRKISTIQLEKEKTLQYNSQQNLDNPLGIYVSSNKNWKLYVNKLTGSKEVPIKYALRVLGGDSSVNCNVTGDYIPINENRILLASGKATFNDSMKCLDKKLINIDYLIRSPENEYLSPGFYSADFEYRLETED